MIPFNIRGHIAQDSEELLLDTYPTNGGGWSVARRIKGDYNGALIRVRRSSDNAEQDIGFVNNELDTVDLLAFVGVGDGFVVTLYNQIGIDNFTQSNTAKQPKVVTAGVLETDNGKPAMLFDGVDDLLDAGISKITSNDGTTLLLGVGDLNGANQCLWGQTITGSNPNRQSIFVGGDGDTRGQIITSTSGNGIVLSVGTQGSGLYTLNYNKIQSELWFNSSSLGTKAVAGSMGNPAWRTLIGAYSSGATTEIFYSNSHSQEFINYPDDNETNITNIQNNIISFYNL